MCFVVKISPRLENLLNIIHEDADLLVINKPAGLVCHPTKSGEMSSLIGRARLHFNMCSSRRESAHSLILEKSQSELIPPCGTATGFMEKARSDGRRDFIFICVNPW